jgi:DNA-binding transcriptional regulator GbsR (MarR family)
MGIPAKNFSSLRLLVLPILLSLIDGERTCSDIAHQSGLSISKVNSVIEELQSSLLVVETTPLVHDQFVEPRFRIADGEAAMATLRSELSENPAPYILEVLDAIRHELPKLVRQEGIKAQVSYLRLVLNPQQAERLTEKLVQVLTEFEELQKVDLPQREENDPQVGKDHYRLSVTFFSVGSDETHQ